MPYASKPLTPGASPWHAFGAELRRARLAADISQARLGDMITYSPSLIGRIEKAERRPSAEFVRRAEAVLDTGGALTRARDKAIAEDIGLGESGN